MIAIRAADLVPPCGRALAGGDRTALTARRWWWPALPGSVPGIKVKPPTPPPAAPWRWSPAPPAAPEAEGEQALLGTMLTTCPQILTASRLWVMDRSFPGADPVARMLAAGTHSATTIPYRHAAH